jgi:hypothetical protein
MTPDERKALREAADEGRIICQLNNMPAVATVSAHAILSLLDALAASEANLEKAREAAEKP